MKAPQAAFDITPFWRNKAYRAENYYNYTYGWKTVRCGACSGSGRYDNTGSPQCCCCDGTGKERKRGTKSTLDAFEKMEPALFNILSVVREEEFAARLRKQRNNAIIKARLYRTIQ